MTSLWLWRLQLFEHAGLHVSVVAEDIMQAQTHDMGSALDLLTLPGR